MEHDHERSNNKIVLPNIEQRMMLKVSPTPNFTTILTGHCNINSYLHKFNIIENPMCPCNKGDQTVDHIIYSCRLHKKERNRLKAAIHRPEKWPVSKNSIVNSIVMNKE